jgi:hypothetical protein
VVWKCWDWVLNLTLGFALIFNRFQPDPIPGFKFSHLKISGPMHYRKMVYLEFLFVFLCSWTKTEWWRHWFAKKAGRRLDLKCYDYTQNSSDLQSKFKNQYQNNSVRKLYSVFYYDCRVIYLNDRHRHKRSATGLLLKLEISNFLESQLKTRRHPRKNNKRVKKHYIHILI